jgi:thiosulfate/3-mercaptopyruvate sulfurtransferase
MEELNIGLGDTVICYENNVCQPPKWACRAAWILKLYGHKNVFILDGGLNAWLDEEFQTFNT